MKKSHLTVVGSLLGFLLVSGCASKTEAPKKEAEAKPAKQQE